MAWQTNKLKEICEVFEDGDWIEKKDQSSSGIRLIQTGNIGNGCFKDRIGKARYITEKTFKRLHCTEIFSGDCLISRLPDPAGRACILPVVVERMITAVDCTIMRFNKKLVDAKWFVYFSLSHEYQNQIDKNVGGATRQRISRKDLGEVKIPLPPYPEQRRIVKILDEVFENIAKARENTEKNLRSIKELFESYLQSVFANPGEGWEEKKLGEVCGYEKKPHKGSDLPYVGLEDIESNSGKFLGSLNPKKVKSNTFHFSNKHVLYGRLRPYLNKALLPDFEGHCSTEIFPIMPHKNLDRGFLFRWITSGKIVNVINATWTGARMPRANMNLVLDLTIPIPPLSEQKTIVKKLDALSGQTKKLEAVYTQKLEDLEELKKSVLKQAFSGKL